MWDEPYGLVVAEALACGVPVAAFARGAIPEILDATCGVLATPDDVSSLASAALSALKLNRSACRTRAEQMCDAERMVDNYEAHYLRQIDRAAAPSRPDRTASIHLIPSTLPSHASLDQRSASHG
jgi:glycosyltransferase involved in cell wall biosynthesis